MVEMVMNILNKFFGLFYGIVAIFKKLMCFLNIKRGRKNSGNILPLHSTSAAALSESVVQQSFPSNDHTDMELESWDSWGVVNQNKAFHDNQMNSAPNNTHPMGGQQAQEEAEEEVDYFQDMVPQVKKPKKIFVRKKEDYSQRGEGFSKRLAVTTEIPLNDDPNLGNWDESENAWGDELSEDLSWEAQSAINEGKRIDREQRQLEQIRKKQERERLRTSKGSSSLTAVKLS